MKKLLFFIGLFIIPSLAFGTQTVVSVIRAEGVVNPVMSEFITTHIDRAEAAG